MFKKYTIKRILNCICGRNMQESKFEFLMRVCLLDGMIKSIYKLLKINRYFYDIIIGQIIKCNKYSLWELDSWSQKKLDLD